MRKNWEADTIELADRIGALGKHYLTQKREKEAEALLQEAVHIYQSKDYISYMAPCCFFNLGKIYNGRNQLIEAEQLLIQGAEMHLKTSAISDRTLALIYQELGDIFRKQNRLEEAQTVLLKTVSILKAMQIQDLFDIYSDLIIVCFMQGKWSEVERYLLQIIDMLEIGLNYAFVHQCLAVTCLKQGKLIDAETAILKGISTLATHCVGRNQELPTFYWTLADIYYAQGRLSEVELVYVTAINEMKSNKSYPNIISASRKLCEFYKSEKRYSEAEGVWKVLIDLFERSAGDSLKYLLTTYTELIKIYWEQEKTSETEVVYEQFMELLQAVEPDEHLMHSLAYEKFTRVFLMQGKLAEAERTITKSINTLVKHFGETHPKLPTFCHILASIYYSQGRLFEAKAAFVFAIDQMKALSDEYYTELIEARSALSVIYCEEENYSEAEGVLDIDGIQRRPEDLAYTYFQLGRLYTKQKRYQEAEQLLRKVLETFIQRHGERDKTIFYLYVALGSVYTASQQLVEGKNMLLRAIEIAKEHPDMHQFLEDMLNREMQLSSK